VQNTLGSNAGSLIHIIARENQPDKVGIFFNNVQKAVNNWLLIEGHTIGIVDFLCDAETRGKIKETIDKAKEDVLETIHRARNHELQSTPGNTLRQTLESMIKKILNDAKDEMCSEFDVGIQQFQFDGHVWSKGIENQYFPSHCLCGSTECRRQTDPIWFPATDDATFHQR